MTKRDPQPSQVEQLSGSSAETRTDSTGVQPCVPRQGSRHKPGKVKSAGTSAQTPEELETMFEDALLIGSTNVLADLFDEEAALVIGTGRPVRDGEAIARLALTTWKDSHSYVADPRYVVQAGDIALILVEGGVNVVHRSREGAWRYVIVLQSIHDDS